MDIEWSPLARLDFIDNIEYLLKKWSEKEVESFIESVEYNLNLLKSNTATFSKTHYRNTYKLVIIKQVSLFYTIQDNKIRLLRFWNNYQDMNNFRL